MSDARLVAHRDLLRAALGVYLRELQRAWGAGQRNGGDEIAGILAAVGMPLQPDPDELRLLDAVQRATAAGGLAGMAEALGLSLGEECLVAAAWWGAADPQVAIAFGCAHDDAARRHASTSLVRLLMEPFGVAVPAAVCDGDPLLRIGVLVGGGTAGDPLRLTPTATQLLAGVAVTPIREDAPPARCAELAAVVGEALRQPRAGIVELCGPRGVGRRAIAVAAAGLAGRPAVGPDRPAAELRLLARMGAAIPVLGATEAEELDWHAEDGPAVIVTERPLGAGHLVRVAAPTAAERAEVWRAGLARVGLPMDDGQVQAIAARFALPDAEIASAIHRAVLDACMRGRPPATDDVWTAARRRPEHALHRLAALVEPVFTLDDLVLPNDARDRLRELVGHVQLQHVVLDDWGFRRRLPRGQGVIALFAGPPGTGKTMAAEALASHLGQDLYRIDLSSVVSKYVGETEKHLAEAFDEAERANAVLFFDEADALFGRRTEVRDAHDRYANIEVNYLLQRVETHAGLVVLATNRQSAIDEAFLRRLRFVIRFPQPDATARRALWHRSFPGDAAVTDLDWDALARLELTGGTIQSAALAAAYLAAADGGTVTGGHLEHALRREHEKLGRAWSGLPAGVPA